MFAARQGRQQKLSFDAELLYAAAIFHDIGLSRSFASQDERFEVDGANAARQFLSSYNLPEEQHTTRGIPRYMRPEVALLYSDVGLDILGRGLDEFPADLRERIVAKYPRKHFREDFITAYFDGFAHKPATTYGTVNAGVWERYIAGYKTLTPTI